MNGDVTRIGHHDAFHLACELVKKAGFEIDSVARNSESCYYRWPSMAEKLLRISTHKSKGSLMGLKTPVAKVTLSPKDDYLSPMHVENLVAMAIGRYFMRSPRPSEYDGPKIAPAETASKEG